MKDEMDAEEYLLRAHRLMVARGETYDSPTGERSMGKAVAAFNAIVGLPRLTESQGLLLMMLLKLVRDRSRAAPHADSIADLVAYAALMAEARNKE